MAGDLINRIPPEARARGAMNALQGSLQMRLELLMQDLAWPVENAIRNAERDLKAIQEMDRKLLIQRAAQIARQHGSEAAAKEIEKL